MHIVPFFNRDELIVLVQAAIAEEIARIERRPILLGGMPVEFRMSLATSNVPSDQLRLDLNTLNDTETVAGLEVPPLDVWLTNAADAASVGARRAIFEPYRRDLRARHDTGGDGETFRPLTLFLQLTLRRTVPLPTVARALIELVGPEAGTLGVVDHDARRIRFAGPAPVVARTAAALREPGAFLDEFLAKVDVAEARWGTRRWHPRIPIGLIGAGGPGTETASYGRSAPDEDPTQGMDLDVDDLPDWKPGGLRAVVTSPVFVFFFAIVVGGVLGAFFGPADLRCPAGAVAKDGACHAVGHPTCAQGTWSAASGECVIASKQQVCPPVPAKKVQPPKLRTACRGTVKGNVCILETTCKGGARKTRSGKVCECPQGMRWWGNRCRKVRRPTPAGPKLPKPGPAPRCSPDQTWYRGRCIPNTLMAKHCAHRGWHWSDGRCLPPCRKGWIRIGERCLKPKDAAKECKRRKKVLRGSRCVDVIRPD